MQFSNPTGGADRLDLKIQQKMRKNTKIPRAEGARKFLGSKNTKKHVFARRRRENFCQNYLNVTDFWSAENHLIKPPLHFAVLSNKGGFL